MKKENKLPKLNYGEVSLVHDIKDQPIRFAQAYHEIKTQSKHSNYRAEIVALKNENNQLRSALNKDVTEDDWKQGNHERDLI